MCDDTCSSKLPFRKLMQILAEPSLLHSLTPLYHLPYSPTLSLTPSVPVSQHHSHTPSIPTLIHHVLTSSLPHSRMPHSHTPSLPHSKSLTPSFTSSLRTCLYLTTSLLHYLLPSVPLSFTPQLSHSPLHTNAGCQLCRLLVLLAVVLELPEPATALIQPEMDSSSRRKWHLQGLAATITRPVPY